MLTKPLKEMTVAQLASRIRFHAATVEAFRRADDAVGVRMFEELVDLYRGELTRRGIDGIYE